MIKGSVTIDPETRSWSFRGQQGHSDLPTTKPSPVRRQRNVMAVPASTTGDFLLLGMGAALGSEEEKKGKWLPPEKNDPQNLKSRWLLQNLWATSLHWGEFLRTWYPICLCQDVHFHRLAGGDRGTIANGSPVSPSTISSASDVSAKVPL